MLKEHSAIHVTFLKLPFVIKICFVYFIKGPFYTGFTVLPFNLNFPKRLIVIRTNHSKFLKLFSSESTK